MTMVRLSTVHIRAALALRLGTQLATARLAAPYSTERERVKDAIGQKKTAEQASRPAERLGGGDTSSSQKPTSASGGGGGAAQNPRADETVESGEPFSHGEREADKQTKHSQDSPPPSGQREPQPEYAGRGKLSVGATPSSAERDQGVRNRDVGAVQDEDEKEKKKKEKKKKETDGEEAGRISRESRGQGGYSQTSMPPRTGAGLSSSSSGSAWLGSIVSRSIFGGGGGGGGAFVATAPAVVLLLASAGGRGLSTSAVALLRKKLSTEEENELGVRGQRPDGSSPQSSDPNSSANSDSEFDPAPAAARSKTTDGVGPGPSYERRASTGMPPSSVEDEMRASKSKDGALGQAGRGGDGAFDSLTARKQPQKGKGVWASVRDAVTPEEEGGKRDAGGGVLKGLKGLKGLKEGVQQVLGQSKKKQ
ncbi:hypothetical protein OC835_006222 [Tilletia horrida]|nr:hypothetical protein OC835_006222 [Tilletia horrida]